MRTVGRKRISETVTAYPWWCALLDRHVVGGREKEMEESVKGSNQWVVSDGTFPISSFSLYWFSWTQSLRKEKREKKMVSFKWNHSIFSISVISFSITSFYFYYICTLLLHMRACLPTKFICLSAWFCNQNLNLTNSICPFLGFIQSKISTLTSSLSESNS